MTVTAKLQREIEKTASGRTPGEVVVRIESGLEGAIWAGRSGAIGMSTPFFAASTTKLYTTTLILQLVEDGVISLDAPLVSLIQSDEIEGLHAIDGFERTGEITVRHLLSHTSGLADYFSGSQKGERSIEQEVRSGKDRSWELADVIDIARRLGALFPPGTPGKASYSDTNFQLLGRVIEVATGLSYDDALHRGILERRSLDTTWMYRDPGDSRPLPLRDGKSILQIPKAMTSFGPDGGLVTNSEDLMGFLRGFFEGEFFDKSVLEALRVYNRIFFPLEYGIGFSRFKLPRLFSPFVEPPELIGHSGLSGAFAFYAPAEDLYLAGTVNNLASPGRSFRLMLKLLRSLK